MIKPKQIPPEVVRAYFEHLWKFPQPKNSDHVAAIAAGLAAWPGMERHTFEESGSGDDYCPPIDEIFLPLTEARDE